MPASPTRVQTTVLCEKDRMHAQFLNSRAVCLSPCGRSGRSVRWLSGLARALTLPFCTHSTLAGWLAGRQDMVESVCISEACCS